MSAIKVRRFWSACHFIQIKRLLKLEGSWPFPMGNDWYALSCFYSRKVANSLIQNDCIERFCLCKLLLKLSPSRRIGEPEYPKRKRVPSPRDPVPRGGRGSQCSVLWGSVHPQTISKGRSTRLTHCYMAPLNFVDCWGVPGKSEKEGLTGFGLHGPLLLVQWKHTDVASTIPFYSWILWKTEILHIYYKWQCRFLNIGTLFWCCRGRTLPRGAMEADGTASTIVPGYAG